MKKIPYTLNGEARIGCVYDEVYRDDDDNYYVLIKLDINDEKKNPIYGVDAEQAKELAFGLFRNLDDETSPF